jgi:hypothetical protein
VRKLIKLQGDDDSNIFIAVDVPTDEKDSEVSNVGIPYLSKFITNFLNGVIEEVKQNYNDAIYDAITTYNVPIINAIDKMKTYSTPPKKVTTKYGLSFDGKGNIYLIETSAKASIEVIIEWAI